MLSDTIATRGNHQPVWNYVVGTDPVTGEPEETRAGTTGIYANPSGDLVTGASKLGAAPGLDFFAVPEIDPPIMFDVFPGAPAVTAATPSCSRAISRWRTSAGQASSTGPWRMHPSCSKTTPS